MGSEMKTRNEKKNFFSWGEKEDRGAELQRFVVLFGNLNKLKLHKFFNIEKKGYFDEKRSNMRLVPPLPLAFINYLYDII